MVIVQVLLFLNFWIFLIFFEREMEVEDVVDDGNKLIERFL